MRKTKSALFCISLMFMLAVSVALAQHRPQTGEDSIFALINGRWFNGKSFEQRTVYSVNGRFTFRKPSRVTHTLDLAGLWIVPPFAEAHNHNLNGIEARDQKAIQKYLADGVFYVKLPGNFFVSDEMKTLYRLNRPEGIDVAMAQGASLTATGGHPYRLAEEVWLRFGYTKDPVEVLNGKRFFTIDSEADLERKWPLILSQRPDFIKTMLWASREHERRKGDSAFRGQYGLDPKFLPRIVAKAHAAGLRVSTHVYDETDFHLALLAGVDEIAHLPLGSLTPITVEDAKLAAKKGVTVVTTCAIVPGLPAIRKSELAQVLKTQTENLRRLHEYGVRLAVGSDNPADSSVREAEYLRELGVLDNQALLKLWTEATAKAIFPERKIGALNEGYEASFLALEGNPLADWQNVHKIKVRFKQGQLLEP